MLRLIWTHGSRCVLRARRRSVPCQPCSAVARLTTANALSRLLLLAVIGEVSVMGAGRLKIALVAAFTSGAVLIGPGVGSAAVGSTAGGGAAGAASGSVLWSN